MSPSARIASARSDSRSEPLRPDAVGITALIGGIQKFSIEDGPGIRTSVFLKGCLLACKWCHNPELIDPAQQLIQSPNNCVGCGHCIAVCPRQALSLEPEWGIVIDRDRCDVCLLCAEQCTAQALRPVATLMTASEVLDVVEQDKDFYDNTGGGMTISGGEVLMHAAFAEALVDEAQARGIGVCLDTCGYGSTEALLTLARKDNVTDVLYDLKAMDPAVHRTYTGVDNQRILDTLRLLAADGTCAHKITVRMPLIKDVNDSFDGIRHAGGFLMQCGIGRVDLLPYHDLGISKQRNIGSAQEPFRQPDEQHLSEIQRYLEDECHLEVGILGRT